MIDQRSKGGADAENKVLLVQTQLCVASRFDIDSGNLTLLYALIDVINFREYVTHEFI
jgi:hypothetical protein